MILIATIIPAASAQTTTTMTYQIINMSDTPTEIMGTSRDDMLSFIALIVSTIMILVFSGRLAGIGMLVSAGTIGLFSFMGWLPLSGLVLVMIYFVAVIFFIAKRRSVS